MCTLAFPKLFPYAENCVFDDIPGVADHEQPTVEQKI